MSTVLSTPIVVARFERHSRLPSHREVAERAYAIFLTRAGNREDGGDLQDWLRAERELIDEMDTPWAPEDRIELDR